jgi:hypothetical protein
MSQRGARIGAASLHGDRLLAARERRFQGRRHRCPEDAATVADESHGVASEIPEDWAQGLEPLNAQHHVIQTQREPIVVEGEILGADDDRQVGAAAGTCEAVAVGHRHSQAGVTLEMNTRTPRGVDVEPESSKAVSAVASTRTES